MGRHFSPEKKAYVQIFGWTLFILSLLSSLNFLIIFSSVGPGIDIPFTRNIASAEEPVVITKDMASPTIELDCKNIPKLLKLNTKAPTARVSFRHCLKVGRIINQSNHNQGDVFALRDDQWTSDFIFLSPGVNQLKIPLNGENYQIEITREMIKATAAKKAL